MFSKSEKEKISAAVEKVLIEMNHPEMPIACPEFELRVSGKMPWSFAHISPNWKFEHSSPNVNPWNEIAREVLVIKGKETNEK